MYIGRYTHTSTQAPPLPTKTGWIDKHAKKRGKAQHTEITLVCKYCAHGNVQNLLWRSATRAQQHLNFWPQTSDFATVLLTGKLLP